MRTTSTEPRPTLVGLLGEPDFPDWGKRVIQYSFIEAMDRDPVDAAHVMEAIGAAFGRRASDILNGTT